jgi:hypothetical protein
MRETGPRRAGSQVASANQDQVKCTAELRAGALALVPSEMAADPFATAVRIAETASIETLAEAISPLFSFTKLPDAPAYFCCPRCRHHDENPGSAQVRSSWRWSCWRCKAEGTVAELRRVALETPDAIIALLAWEQ